MDYAFKITTEGMELLAACAAAEKPLKLTRVTFGSGKVPEGTKLADQTHLITPVADGTIIQRSHQDSRLNLTVRYNNKDHPEQATFPIGEFMVYAQHPTDEAEKSLIYATLGDYAQPVPQYTEAYPPSTFSYPMVVIVSDEIEVTVESAPGSVNFDDLEIAIAEHNVSPEAHKNILEAINARTHVIATRQRDPGKPDYGMGGGGGERVALKADDDPKASDISIIASGREYGALNISTDGETAPDGALIIKKEK